MLSFSQSPRSSVLSPSAGCIIRSVFLDDIAKAYTSAGSVANLMMIEPFTSNLKRSEGALRRVVATAALRGIAVPAKNYGHDLDAMAAAIDDETYVAWVANPNNPTGTLLDRATLEAVGTLAQRYDCVAMEYGIEDGIEDGYLVPVRQRPVDVHGAAHVERGVVPRVEARRRSRRLGGARLVAHDGAEREPAHYR